MKNSTAIGLGILLLALLLCFSPWLSLRWVIGPSISSNIQATIEPANEHAKWVGQELWTRWGGRVRIQCDLSQALGMAIDGRTATDLSRLEAKLWAWPSSYAFRPEDYRGRDWDQVKREVFGEAPGSFGPTYEIVFLPPPVGGKLTAVVDITRAEKWPEDYVDLRGGQHGTVKLGRYDLCLLLLYRLDDGDSVIVGYRIWPWANVDSDTFEGGGWLGLLPALLMISIPLIVAVVGFMAIRRWATNV
ncbi:MAG: hypothetical protein QXN33_00205 [Candidatus Bathyarchaeia archaeon]